MFRKAKKILRESKVEINFVDNVRVSDDMIINGKTVGEWKAEDKAQINAAFSLKKDVKIGGVIPQVNLKAGYVFKNDTLVYGKLGCAFTKGSIDSYSKFGNGEWIKDEDSSGSKTKASLILGLGAEKAFCKKFSTAIEADYNFGWKYKGYEANRGWSVRALVKYNVKY